MKPHNINMQQFNDGLGNKIKKFEHAAIWNKENDETEKENSIKNFKKKIEAIQENIKIAGTIYVEENDKHEELFENIQTIIDGNAKLTLENAELLIKNAKLTLENAKLTLENIKISKNIPGFEVEEKKREITEENMKLALEKLEIVLNEINKY